MEKDDNRLISDYLKGDEESFVVLTRRYLKPVYNFVLRMRGNVDDAEDITQETFLRAWQKIRKFKKGGNFKAWIFTIARNAGIDSLRKKKIFVFSDFETEGGENPLADNLIDLEPLQDQVFSRVEDGNFLEEILKKIPAAYKEVLILHYKDELTFEEIGKILGKPLNTVKSWHYRALLTLRKIIYARA